MEVARIDWRNFLHLLWWREANMSLYYVLLRVWLHFGHSPFFIRSLSVAISAATLPAIYWLANMLYDRRVALIAAALFAFNVLRFRYAQEARSYALFVLLATLSSGFLIASCKEPSRRNRIAYVLLQRSCRLRPFLCAFADRGALDGVCVGRVFRDSTAMNRMRALSAQLRRAWITIGIAVFPLLIFVAKTGAGPIKWIQRPAFGIFSTFCEHLAGSDTWFCLRSVCGACLVRGLIPLRKTIWRATHPGKCGACQFLFVWLLFPIVLTVLLSFARPVFLPRYMIFCIPAL